MLPKVSAALSKFISPVATSTSQPSLRREFERDPQKRRGQAQRGTPDQRKEDPSQDSPKEGSFKDGSYKDAPSKEGFKPFSPPVVPKSTAASNATPAPQSAAASAPAVSSTQTFLQLVTSLNIKRGISKIIVAIAYRATAKAQKSSGTARKGAVLDHKG